MVDRDATKRRFWEAYKRVALAVQVDANQAHAAECFRVVEGYGADVFDLAATRLISGHKYRTVPLPAEWAEACRAEQDGRIAREHQVYADAAAAYREQDARRYCCEVCLDTGWELAPGGKPLVCTRRNSCGICRRQGHHLYDHTFTRACSCRQSNPVYQDKAARSREMAQSRQAATRKERAA